MSYIYVRTNIKDYVTDKGRLGLLSIFLKAMYDPNYINECENYGFTPVPADVRTKALDTLSTKVDFDDVADEWKFEVGIEKIDGQGEKVISPKRRSFAEYERSTIADGLESVGGGGSGWDAKYDALLVEVKLLMAKYEEKEKEFVKLQTKLMKLEKDTDDHTHPSSSVFAIISFVLWCLAIVYLVLMKVFLNEGSDVDVDMKKEQDFA